MHLDWWSRKEHSVLKAVEVFGAVEDRKALHKILYFANLKTRAFKYQWYKYGPFSPELGYKIADHVCDKSIDVKECDAGALRRGMTLSGLGADLLADSSYEEVDSALSLVHALLSGVSPRRLDLLASAHFIIWSGYKQSEAVRILRGMKPAFYFSDAEAQRAVEFLQSRDFAELDEDGAIGAAAPRRPDQSGARRAADL